MATFIDDCMSGPARSFHSVKHALDISKGADSIQKIAAYFHDVIYYAIDGGFSDEQATVLGNVVVEDVTDAEKTATVSIGKSESFSKGGESADWAVAMTLAVFGFEPGQVLNPFGGLNEFLSAVVAVRMLEGKISKQDLFRIVACIEATIPFRSNVGDNLCSRLEATNESFALEMNQDELVKTTQSAIDLANRDVANFAYAPHLFLDQSWNLMPETNVPLREDTWSRGEDFKISEFAFAVKKMRAFFDFLKAELVFHQFRGYPDDETYNNLLSRARDNIDIARKYMKAKMLCASFLGSVAELTGGDNPVSHWGQEEDNGEEIDVFPLPELKAYEGVELDERVFMLLDKSVAAEIAALDISQTATAPLLYGMMGDEAIEKSLEFTSVPMTEDLARKYLDSLPIQALVPLLSNLQKTCVTNRREGLKKLLEGYEGQINDSSS